MFPPEEEKGVKLTPAEQVYRFLGDHNAAVIVVAGKPDWYAVTINNTAYWLEGRDDCYVKQIVDKYPQSTFAGVKRWAVHGLVKTATTKPVCGGAGGECPPGTKFLHAALVRDLQPANPKKKGPVLSFVCVGGELVTLCKPLSLPSYAEVEKRGTPRPPMYLGKRGASAAGAPPAKRKR